ncbi:MAG: diacylglycerol kinase family lipid kinase [Nisaea sp.]|uniref:diacylglycerol/lipid kinase family protein n=1 Tax=Nisaea sp. TaxID=2024842 RepID=UPI001B0BBA4D|nr:diacylglycerol kinase family protein [Nisaea sp.]MBO6561018.1 diacylglycerol kinase family lipid kinase [Nisaea sp.]
MRVVAVLNRDGGTFKTTDMESYCDTLRRSFSARGGEIDCRPTSGKEIVDALEDAAGEDKYDALIAGGGDGTVSAATSIAWKKGKPLGVLPAGTMNMFARALGLPLDLEQAADALAEADQSPCDIATANGRPFVHQFSVGMQPRIIGDRNSFQYYSRIGKMIAGLRATLATFHRPPAFPARIATDDDRLEGRYSLIVVSNNLYGDGHLPYADDLSGGALGLGQAAPLKPHQNLQLIADFVIGNWRANPDFEMAPARSVTLEFPKLTRKAKATIDGELVRLEKNVELKIHPGALTVLKPKP